MAKCYLCGDKVNAHNLITRLTFMATVGQRNINLKGIWLNDKSREITLCKECCASGLAAFAKALMESSPGESRFIM